jgi:hypothetical protein
LVIAISFLLKIVLPPITISLLAAIHNPVNMSNFSTIPAGRNSYITA